MRKSIEAIKGDKLINIRNNKIFKVAEVCGDTFVIIDENEVAKTYSKSNIKRWFKMYQEYVEPEVVEPVQPVQPVEVTNNSFLETVISLAAAHNCTVKQQKQHISIYNDNYKGTIVQICTNKKGDVRFDIKQKIFDSFNEQYKQYLKDNFDAKVYDKTRNYIRLSNVTTLDVLSKIIITALAM